MESIKEQMLMMHTMCQNEIDLLKMNVDKFIAESKQCQKLLNEINSTEGATNIFALIIYDRYMTQLVNVLSMARRFNINLEINNLDQSVINASSNGCLDDANYVQTRLLKDFFEWRNNHLENFSPNNRETAPCGGKIKMVEDNSKLVSKLVEYSKATKFKIEKCDINDISHGINRLLKSLLPAKSLEQFKSGYEFNAYIVYVQDYKKLEFFICQIDDYKTLYDFSNNLNFKVIPRKSLLEGKVFCVLEKKDTTVRECLWRAVIIPTLEKTYGSKKFMYLLDFGEIIPLTNHCTVYEAPPHYKETPPLAIKCVLNGIEDQATKCIIRDQDKCEQFLDKNEFEKDAFRIVCERNGVLHVLLLIKTPPSNETTTATYNLNPFLNHSNLGNDDKLSVTSVALQLPKSVIYHVSPIMEPILIINAEAGDKIQVAVTHIISPLSFYAIIQNDYCGGCKTFSWHDNQIPPLQKEFSAPPELNDILLSQYVKDDYWYRAKVIDIDSDKQFYKVFYVDFGNSEVVPLNSLAKCSEEQLNDPLRAVLFHLSNLTINSISEENSYFWKTTYKNAIENMVVMLLDQVLTVEVVKRCNDELIIRLIDSQYNNIPKMLVDMGVVKEI